MTGECILERKVCDSDQCNKLAEHLYDRSDVRSYYCGDCYSKIIQKEEKDKMTKFGRQFKFRLGEIVLVDPIREGKGMKGRVNGLVQFLDGSQGYYVSTRNYGSDGVIRNLMTEYDLMKVEE